METQLEMNQSSVYDMIYEPDMITNVTDNTSLGREIPMFPEPHFVGRFLQSSTMVTIFIAALLGNMLVILLCLKKPAELKVSRRLILHLAVLNLNMAVLVLPSVIISAVAQDWILSYAWCMATGFFKTLFCVCIILNLVVISLDRYFSVVKPLHYHCSATVKYHGVFLGVIWVISVLVALPPLVGWNKIAYHPSRYICTGDWSKTDPSYSLFVFLGGFIIPFLSMTYVYWTIYRAARALLKRKRGRRLSHDDLDSVSASGSGAASGQLSSNSQKDTVHSENSTGSRKSNPRSSRVFGQRRRKRDGLNVTDEWNVAKTGVIVMATFVICWLPYYIVLMVDAAYGFGSTVPLSIPYAWWECFAMWMALSSCAINPYVYVLRSPPMRQQASKVARNTFARCRQCCEEDSRKVRRRQSGRTGRYSLARISSRFGGWNKKPEIKSEDRPANSGDPEVQTMMPQPAQKADQKNADQIDGVIPPAEEVVLLSHKKLDV